jgi:hypothetical protein
LAAKGDWHRLCYIDIITRKQMFSLGFRIMQMRYENKSSVWWGKIALKNSGKCKKTIKKEKKIQAL